MKRFLGLIALTHLLVPYLFAQPTVVWGPKVKQSGSLVTKSLSQLPLSSSFAYKTKSLYRSSIQRIGADLVPGEDETLENSRSRLKMEPQFQFQFGSDSYLASKNRDSKTSTYQIYLEKIGQNSPTLSTAKVIEGRIPGAGLHFMAQNRPIVSPDGNLMVMVTKRGKIGGDYTVFQLKVFDQSLDLVWEKEIDVARTDHILTIEDFLVDNEGNVFLSVSSTEKESKTNADGEAAASFLVLAYLDQGNTANEYKMEVAGQYVTDLKMDVATNGNLAIAGFYSENKNYETKGCFYLLLDEKTGKVISESTKEFDQDFLNQYLSDREEKLAASRSEKGKSNELLEYELRNIIPRSDGGSFVVAEQYFLTMHTVGPLDATTGLHDRDTREYSYTEYHLDILIAGIDPQGKIEWVRKVPKRQVELVSGPKLSSFALMETDQKLYLIFNDNPENMNKGPKEQIKYFRLEKSKLMVTVASIDLQGNVELQYLKNGEPMVNPLRPTMCQQVSPTEMLLYAENGSIIQYGKMVFKE